MTYFHFIVYSLEVEFNFSLELLLFQSSKYCFINTYIYAWQFPHNEHFMILFSHVYIHELYSYTRIPSDCITCDILILLFQRLQTLSQCSIFINPTICTLCFLCAVFRYIQDCDYIFQYICHYLYVLDIYHSILVDGK